MPDTQPSAPRFTLFPFASIFASGMGGQNLFGGNPPPPPSQPRVDSFQPLSPTATSYMRQAFRHLYPSAYGSGPVTIGDVPLIGVSPSQFRRQMGLPEP